MELKQFKITVLPLRGKLLNYARTLTENSDDAEDAVQEVNSGGTPENLLFQAGYGCLGITARFAMTSMFEKGNAPELYPASIGLGWYW